MTPRTIRLKLAYDGTDFFGWQFQPGMRTVQSVLEDAIQRVTGETSRAVGAGRTDTGVHAWGQAVTLTTATRLANQDLLRAINANLPQDVAVLNIDSVPDGFNAIDQSTGKRYCYLIQDGAQRDVFTRKYAWKLWYSLDVNAMHQAAQSLRGTHDFSAFENQGSPRVSSIRTIRDILVERRSFAMGDRTAMEVEADGFLYNMVRNIVGTLVEVGKGKRSIQWPAEVLAGRQRTQAGMCAPPHGLYLAQVFY